MVEIRQKAITPADMLNKMEGAGVVSNPITVAVLGV